MAILIKEVTILDTHSPYHKQVKDISIKNGIITEIGDNLIVQKGQKTLDAKSSFATMGWIDLFADFCNPGFEHKETFESAADSAIKGGFTHACIIPNTSPCVSNATQVSNIINSTHNLMCNILPMGSISKNIEGDSLAEMIDMHHAGAVAFTDGTKPVQNSVLMLKALQYVQTFGGCIFQVPLDKQINAPALMNEGVVSTQLGVQGSPSIAETILLKRDIDLLRYTKSKLHVTGISCAESVALIRQAKKEKLSITCSVSPHYLLYNDEILSTYDSNYKLNPPLRTEADRLALIEGVIDGTIDAIASHHFPQHWDAKNVEFEYAGYGIAGIETVLHTLASIKELAKPELVNKLLSQNPRNITGFIGGIVEDTPASITIFNLKQSTNYTQKETMGVNTPLLGKTLNGKVVAVFNNNLYKIF